VPREVAIWWHPDTGTVHLSERCARQAGRPAMEGLRDLLADNVWDAPWCSQCARPETVQRRLEGQR